MIAAYHVAQARRSTIVRRIAAFMICLMALACALGY